MEKIKNVDIIENVRNAIKPKSILKAFWNMIAGKPESIEQTDADKEALEIYYENNKKNIDGLEKLVTISEKENTGKKIPQYGVNAKNKGQEKGQEIPGSKSQKAIDDDYVR